MFSLKALYVAAGLQKRFPWSQHGVNRAGAVAAATTAKEKGLNLHKDNRKDLGPTLLLQECGLEEEEYNQK